MITAFHTGGRVGVPAPRVAARPLQQGGFAATSLQ
jgi:hypothetical protein